MGQRRITPIARANVRTRPYSEIPLIPHPLIFI